MSLALSISLYVTSFSLSARFSLFDQTPVKLGDPLAMPAITAVQYSGEHYQWGGDQSVWRCSQSVERTLSRGLIHRVWRASNQAGICNERDVLYCTSCAVYSYILLSMRAAETRSEIIHSCTFRLTTQSSMGKDWKTHSQWNPPLTESPLSHLCVCNTGSCRPIRPLLKYGWGEESDEAHSSSSSDLLSSLCSDSSDRRMRVFASDSE